MDQQKFAANLYALRKAKKLTQKGLAEKLNVTDKAVSKWERGLSYPDITLIPPLAEILGVSASELLSGENGQEAAEAPEKIVQATLEFVKQTESQRHYQKASVTLATISLLFVVAVFVCVLCDFLTTGKSTWSVFVIGSVLFAWAVLFPLIYCKKHRLRSALVCFSLFLLPLLALIEYASPSKGWFFPLAVPISLLGLAYLWAVYCLLALPKWNRWFSFGIISLLSAGLDVAINRFISSALQVPAVEIDDIITVFCLFCLGIFCIIHGIQKTKEKRSAAHE